MSIPVILPKTMIRSLYIHIPFCNHICWYCDFTRRLYDEKSADEYLDHLEKELAAIDQDSFVTAYVGGGTPSALSEKQLERLLKMVNRFHVEGELTIEINPESLTKEKALIMKRHGVNRASIGIQSFNERILNEIGRKHDRKDINNCFSYLLEAGITNISCDLMYGYNEQTLADLLDDLNRTVKLPVKHISIYDLEVHDDTVLGHRHYEKPDDETEYLMYETIISFLKEHGFEQYEVSNFALNGYQSEHNKTYWHYEDYYGAGAGASGKVDHKRYDNTDSIAKYNRDEYREEVTELSKDDEIFEAVMMGLRLLEGINIRSFNEKYSIDLLKRFEKAVNRQLQKGNLELTDGYLRVTYKGLFVLNDILVDFMEAL